MVIYRVMIVDDERAIRNLLKKCIKWEQFDMEVAGEAESGIEAINIIDDIQPHIVFVDIRMPFMDGIEFSRLVKERYPKMKIVVLTAFGEFEYARECIGIGVSAYILKPIQRADIQKVLQDIRKKLDEEEPAEEKEYMKRATVGKKVTDYVSEHYADESLNLTKLAIVFGYNASYLSRLIKQEMDRTFTEILMEKRMRYACKYALSGMPMYLAAREVGIPDPNYFGKCFKKYTGVTYSEYMNQKEHGDGEGTGDK